MSTRQFVGILKDIRRALVFTGAGLSTGSGIPDFRGPGGVWKTWRPVYYDEFMSSHDARIRHWQYKLENWSHFRDAQPNAAHRSLYELDEMGHIDTIVTQNIDGLHALAGHPDGKVIELHGTNQAVECQSCGKRSDPDPIFRQFEEMRDPPTCECGGFLKPATVSFGQQMPQRELHHAFEAAGRADLVLTIGSTLEVEPAASITRAAKEQGAIYVIVNRGPTAHDHLADLRMEGDATVLLPQAVRDLNQMLKARP